MNQNGLDFTCIHAALPCNAVLAGHSIMVPLLPCCQSLEHHHPYAVAPPSFFNASLRAALYPPPTLLIPPTRTLTHAIFRPPSARSHSIMVFSLRNMTVTPSRVVGKLSFIDLAGSERGAGAAGKGVQWTGDWEWKGAGQARCARGTSCPCACSPCVPAQSDAV